MDTRSPVVVGGCDPDGVGVDEDQGLSTHQARQQERGSAVIEK